MLAAHPQSAKHFHTQFPVLPASETSTLHASPTLDLQVAVEAFTGGAELDYGLLEGKWRLRYTTARDVLPLVSPQRLPAPLQVGWVGAWVGLCWVIVKGAVVVFLRLCLRAASISRC